jgi:cytochrome c553
MKKLSADIFKSVVASEAFDHLEAKTETSDSVSNSLEGREKPTNPRAENTHAKFAGFYEDYLQKALNDIHKEWRDKNYTLEQMLENLPTDTHKMLFALAKLHYQVQNGGFQQWIDNGYAGNGQGDLLIQDLPTQGVLGNIRAILIRVLEALQDHAEENDSECHSFDDAEEVLRSTSNSDRDTWTIFCESNPSEVASIEQCLGFDLESHQMEIQFDTDEIPVEEVKKLPQQLEDMSDCDAWMSFIDDHEQSTVMQWLDLDESGLREFETGLGELYKFFNAFNAWERNGGDTSDLEGNLDNCDTDYYRSVENDEEYFQEVSNFLETLEPNVASLKASFKLGSMVTPYNSRPFRVIAAANTTDDYRIQARYLDGSIESLNKKKLAVLTNSLGTLQRRFSNFMRTAYNKDFDLYVKTAIREAGLPVDDDMNWSNFLEKIYKSVSNDPDLRDEVAHHMIITHLYHLRTLNKFDAKRGPDQDNELAKKVTTFLKKMFSYSVSKARDWIGVNYGYGKTVKEEVTNPETGKREEGMVFKKEIQPEYSVGDQTFNILDNHSVNDDHSDIESSQDFLDFKNAFYPWLIQDMGKIVGPNLVTLFEATLNNEDPDAVWEEFKTKTSKSYSYYKKAVANLRECIRKFVATGKVDTTNLLVRLVNDYNKKLQKMVPKEQPVTSSLEENKVGKLAELIAKKKLAAKATEVKATPSKYAKLKRLAADEPEAIGEAIAELRDKFMSQVEALDALAENLNLTPEDVEPGLEGVEPEAEFSEFEAEKSSSKKASKFAAGLRRTADEEPEEVEISLNEIYSNIDVLAQGVENLADNLGVELVEEPSEEEAEESTEEAETEEAPAE